MSLLQPAREPSPRPRPSIDVRAAFDRVRAAQKTDPFPTYERRIERLDRLARAIRDRQGQIAAAISRDFGNRSIFETKLAEVLMLLDAIKYLRRNLKAWMRPQERHVAVTYKPARAKVHLMPVGVVGVISPWNYPFQLALGPTVVALAAGNRVLLKPSEYTPATSDLLQRLCEDVLDPDVVAVVPGGPEVGEAFSRLPFDHLVYTGSTHVGRLVMRAAAENLVPVTLELGGKSPTIVHADYPVSSAAARIAWGKWSNAGQTCIAPDYLFVPEHKLPAYVEALTACARRAYPTLRDNPDYTSIVNERHFGRLTELVEDAVAKGAHKIEIKPSAEALPPEARKIAPTLLTGVTEAMKVMQEEVFGPVLPILTYRRVEDALAYVNDHPRPLAFYYFDRDRRRVEQVLRATISGGASINETMLHFGIDDMPFGGVGPSGMGAYHGREGFENFSHKRAVLYQARYNAASLLAPPYGERLTRMLKLLIG
ncbi:MAG TPA: coniferyl aldehyde dehydrogenase [Polyangiaceae bacterium]|nr:coniferyl aldehyde dehydrogenase [Polyangiaceae bacterium]